MTVQRIELRQHPLSAAFPAMPDTEIAALALDIEKHGQREPGVLLDGKVLDGWHRYLACQQAKTQFRAVEFNGVDPIGFVLSRNLHRRHLTASQRAACVVACHEWRPNGVSRGANLHGLETRAEMAGEAQVSERTIVHAKQAHAAGLGEQVKEGIVSAHVAAEVGKLPAAERKKAVKALKEGRAPKPPKSEATSEEREFKKLYEEAKAELAETKEALAEMTALAESAKAFQDKQEFKEMQVLRLELASCKRRRDELMRENGEMKKQIGHWKKRAEKAEGKRK